MSEAVLLAAGAAGAGVAGAWEAVAAVERTRVASAATRVLEPLARAGREGRIPTAPERRRLRAVAAAALLAAGWLVGGVVVGVLAALSGPAIVLGITRARRRRWREELRRAAPACAPQLLGRSSWVLISVRPSRFSRRTPSSQLRNCCSLAGS